MTQRLNIVFSLLTLSSVSGINGFTNPQLVSLFVFDHISHPDNNPLSFIRKKLDLDLLGLVVDGTLGNMALDDLTAIYAHGTTGHVVTVIDRIGKDIALSATTKATLYTLAYLTEAGSKLSNIFKAAANYIAGFDEQTTMRALGFDHKKRVEFEEEEEILNA